MRRRRDTDGFALLTTLVMLAVVVTLAAVMVVNLRGIEEERDVQSTFADLTLLDAAIENEFLASSRYVLQLAHLAQPPTAADKNSCGAAWNIAHSSNWQTKSPFGPFYVKRFIPVGTGFPLGIGLAMDTMVRVPATTTGAGTLTIRILAVTLNQAAALDTLFDTGNGAGAGKIQWTAPVSERIDTLKFVHTRGNTSC
jgi:type II secretory pathway pseudopilin PulG